MTFPSESSTHKQIDIALFGGAFDPITLGHMAVAMGVHAQTGYPVWIMPCYEHKHGKEMAMPAHRYLMVQHVCDALGPAFRPSPYEIEKKHNGSTYDLMTMMKKEYPQYLFHLVIGCDNIATIIHKWDRGGQLVKENPVLIVDRPGFEPAGLVGAHPLSRHITVGFPSASRDVRSAIEQGQYDVARRQLYHKVWHEVEVQGLYGFKQAGEE